MLKPFNMKPFYIIILFCTLLGCVNDDSNIAAIINDQEIKFDEVDNIAIQELYDELNRIYQIRTLALEELIDKKLLQIEADKRLISEKELVNNLYKSKICDSLFKDFCKKNGYDSGVNVLERTFKTYDRASKRGHFLATERLKESILSHFVDSLRTVNDIEICILPPLSPKISLKDISFECRGNIKSKVTVTILSDYDCEMCRKFYPKYDSLFIKYKANVKFAYANLSSYTTLSSLAAKCAALQGKYWAMHDSLYHISVDNDTSKVITLAYDLGLNMEQFLIDL